MKTTRTLLLLISLCALAPSFGQSVGISDDAASTIEASAMLDVNSTSKGMLIPRMSSSDRESISEPAAGLMVYDTSESALYYYTGSTWVRLEAVVVGDDSGDLPTTPYVGQLYLDTSGSSEMPPTDDKLYIYTSDNKWAQVTLGAASSTIY